MVSAPGGHLYRHPDSDNLFTLNGSESRFGNTAGAIWCWTHGAWESIPQEWHDREAMLRDEITVEWERTPMEPVTEGFARPVLTDAIVRYCKHRNWRKPDMNDRYAVFRFLRDMKECRPVQ